MADVKFMDVPSGTPANSDYVLVGNDTNGVRKATIEDLHKLVTNDFKFTAWQEVDWDTTKTKYKPAGAYVRYRYNKYRVQLSVNIVEATSKFANDGGTGVVNIAVLPEPARFISYSGVSSGEQIAGAIPAMGTDNMGEYFIGGDGTVGVFANYDGGRFFVEYSTDANFK